MTRSLARRLLRGRVPDEIAFGTSRGVQNGDWFDRVTKQRASMLHDVEWLKNHPAVGRVVDLDRLHALLKDWPSDLVAAESRRSEYLQMLTRGVEMAKFIAWHEGGN